MKVTTILLAAVATVMAAPFPTNSTTVSNTTAPTHLTKRSSPMCENCFSCKATQQGPVLRYKLRIGAPFDNGSGCANIKKALDDAGDVPDIDKFSCKDDKGMTKIAFTAWDYNQGWGISQVFNRMYPKIKGDGYGFNCPNY